MKINVDYSSLELKQSLFHGDVTRYQQVFLNVLSNAVKFGPEDSEVTVRISIQKLSI